MELGHITSQPDLSITAESSDSLTLLYNGQYGLEALTVEFVDRFPQFTERTYEIDLGQKNAAQDASPYVCGIIGALPALCDQMDALGYSRFSNPLRSFYYQRTM